MTPVPERDADPVNRSGAFEVVRRGYARDQVDALVRELERRARAAENARRMAEQHAAGLAEELRTLRAGTPAEGLPAVPQSFGFRAEKVLRLAEREASDIRAAATREAAEIRAAATREAAELMERAHASAGRARAEAETERAVVAAERAHLATQVTEHVRQAEELAGLRVAVRGELARVHAALGAELRALDGTPSGDPAQVPGAPEPATPAEGAALPVGPPEDGVETADLPGEPAGDAADASTEAATTEAGTTDAATTDRIPVEAEPDQATEPEAAHPAAANPAAGNADETRAVGTAPEVTGEDPAADPETPGPAVWTPTPGTADLFAAEQDRQAARSGEDRAEDRAEDPADRRGVRVPEQRREQSTESRHALRSG
ncbi:hypothetical protein GCM10023215_18590 [Pseudonocardia yuanmonensis]|uniref:DivIVA domain-containing protein n=1 Tax=Pseudonocardia yuanmonensis TaxID=1095914 RepID=A0ABP8W8W2_9PSEU